MGRRFQEKYQISVLLSLKFRLFTADCRSLRNVVYIIFVHKLQKRVFSAKFLDNPGNLNYINKEPVYVNHLINRLLCS